MLERYTMNKREEFKRAFGKYATKALTTYNKYQYDEFWEGINKTNKEIISLMKTDIAKCPVCGRKAKLETKSHNDGNCYTLYSHRIKCTGCPRTTEWFNQPYVGGHGYFGIDIKMIDLWNLS